ncbi:MAG TPA: DUF1629 domain-containing protein [Kofleriaceae bacterium]|nr:DUF1629 domain-containing protein [Kofleriaceae bacterium]
MYFRLSMDLVDGNVFVKPVSNKFVSLISGATLPADTPVPFQYAMEVDLDQDGNEQAPRFFPFISPPCIMTAKFLDVLRGAGVDNIQTFPAILTDSRTGAQCTDYSTVNVIGLVACANVPASDTSPLADVAYFHKLVIDPKRTGGLLLFRLAESQSEIIIHEKVARAIEAAQFEGVVLEPLEEAT